MNLIEGNDVAITKAPFFFCFLFLLCQASLSGCERSNFWTVKLTCLSLYKSSQNAAASKVESSLCQLLTITVASFISNWIFLSYHHLFCHFFLSLLFPIHFLWLTSFWTRLNSEIMRPVLKVVNKEIKLEIHHPTPPVKHSWATLVKKEQIILLSMPTCSYYPVFMQIIAVCLVKMVNKCMSVTSYCNWSRCIRICLFKQFTFWNGCTG